MESKLKTINDHQFQSMLNKDYRDEAGNIIVQEVYLHYGPVIEIAGEFYRVVPKNTEEIKK